nr:MAG TPA: hypothetical protein [Caudoviricetes sp.]
MGPPRQSPPHPRRLQRRRHQPPPRTRPPLTSARPLFIPAARPRPRERAARFALTNRGADVPANTSDYQVRQSLYSVTEPSAQSLRVPNLPRPPPAPAALRARNHSQDPSPQ